ncbi:MAG: hypothetical protein RLZZ360_755 [Candidatus Parcubacteria bacterium]
MTGWHFTSVPKAESTTIKGSVKVKAGFGSIPVEVQVGKQIWTTSIFPDKKSGQYLLPLKATVRKKEGIYADDTIKVRIKLLV